jgi:site-specific DNA-methyltransferase (adenine-specific)
MPSATIDLVFADPPYHLSNGGFSVASGRAVSVNKGAWDKSLGVAADFAFHEKWLAEVQRLLTPNGTVVVSGTYHSIYKCGFAMENLGYRILNELIWYKPNAAPNLAGRNFAASHETLIWASKGTKSKHTFNYAEMKMFDDPKDFIKNPGKQMRDVWAISSTPMSEKSHGRHPTQKPLKLLERIVLACSNPGDVVLDPFLGSGTTGVAALRLGRNFVGIEQHGEYIDLSRRRLQEEGQEHD